MAAKQGPLNQCDILHPIYGLDNCCLCGAKSEVNQLKSDISWLLQFVELPPDCSYATKQYMKKHIAEIRQRASKGLLLN